VLFTRPVVSPTDVYFVLTVPPIVTYSKNGQSQRRIVLKRIDRKHSFLSATLKKGKGWLTIRDSGTVGQRLSFFLPPRKRWHTSPNHRMTINADHELSKEPGRPTTVAVFPIIQ
jgi:hypothetical protein